MFSFSSFSPGELGQVAGLVVPVIDLNVVQQPPAVLGDTEQVNPGAVGTAGPAREVLPSTATATATALNRPRASALSLLDGPPRTVARGEARARPADQDGPAPPGSSSHLVPVPACHRVPRRMQPGQILLAGPLDPLPDRGEPVVPSRGERARRDRDRAGQRVDPAPPLSAASAGPAAPPASATSVQPGPGRHRDRIRPRVHPRATMPMRACHTFVHVDLRDLHDRVACPRPSTVRPGPIAHMPDKTG